MAKKFQNLTIKDAFMFAAVMNDEEACRQFLERVLEMQILKVTVITEKTINYNPDYHGVRLDVLAVENGTQRRFNVEMQVKSQKDLPRRCRYYHSVMDMDVLPTSMDYAKLPECYVIFICDFDPIGSALYRYTFQMTCKENGKILQDGSQTILLSTKGKNAEAVPRDLVAFLQYVADPGSSSSDGYTRFLDDKIAAIKQDRVWEAKYMLFEEMMRDEREEGRKEGMKEGQEKGMKEGLEKGMKKGHEEGMKEGRKEGILLLLQDLGEVPEDIRQRIVNEDDGCNLKELNRMAARAESLEEFRNQLEKLDDK